LLLTQIVRGIQNALFSYKDTSSYTEITRSHKAALSHYYKNVYKVVHPSWPLRRGSVKKSFLPWNTYPSSHECIQACTAFAIKSFSTLNNSCFQQNTRLFEEVYFNSSYCVLFWSFLQDSSDKIFYSKNMTLAHRVIFLCLEDTVFPMRHNANEDFILFERFIEHAVKYSAGLVVFSKQAFFSSKAINFQNSYSMSYLKNAINSSHKLSIENIFMPQAFEFGGVESDGAKNSRYDVGSFDRLLELLSLGQDFIFSMEQEFKKAQSVD